MYGMVTKFNISLTRIETCYFLNVWISPVIPLYTYLDQKALCSKYLHVTRHKITFSILFYSILGHTVIYVPAISKS